MWKYIPFALLLVGAIGGFGYMYSFQQNEKKVLEKKYTSQIEEIYALQGKRYDPGLDPIENQSASNGSEGYRVPGFKGVGAVAGATDSQTGLVPVGAVTDAGKKLPGSVIELTVRSLFYRDTEQGYYCDSRYLAQAVIWIKDIPVSAIYAPCVAKSYELYWPQKIKASDVRVEYTTDRATEDGSSDLLISEVILDGLPLPFKNTDASWKLNQCTDMTSVPAATREIIMQCNGVLTFGP